MSKRKAQLRRATRSARDHAERWRRLRIDLYEEAPTAYVMLDRRGILRDINRAGLVLLGVSRGATGLPFRTFVVPADRGQLAVHLARYAKDGDAVSEMRMRSDAGREIAAVLGSRPSAADPDLSLTSIFDISAARAAEENRRRLMDAERAARDSNDAKDLFIASLSHELRAPLAPVLVAVSTLISNKVTAEAEARLLEIIRRNVVHEARLIDDLLDVTRVGSGKLRLDRVTTNLHQAVDDALEMLRSDIEARALRLTIDLEAPRHHVDGDPIRLRQVFANLIKNAVGYTEPGGAIGARSWNRANVVVVEISDTGEGLDEEALTRIFNRFEQVGTAAHGARGGLGLGLPISKGIVALHGGVIAAHSAGRGKGSRFLVELECVPAPKAHAHVSEARPPAAQQPSMGQRILLVEDEPDLAETLALALEQEGYAVERARTANAALDADLDRVSVLISDIGLPDLDGRDLLARVRAKRDIKAIALSGYGTEADVRASQDAGFLRHLTKPVEMAELLSAIALALGSP